MSKVANYLNEHILGEVSSNAAIREALSTDAGPLKIMPEMVVYPRTTNDIRKVARFSSQLAEKGHALPITPRGGGSDQTGAAIGKGIIVNTTAHMNSIFELDAKQRLVRLQPGVTFKALNDALRLHGLFVPSYPMSEAYSTIGGAIANNASGIMSGKYGATGSWVHQIEVVLSNGDVLQTGRISKRELNRKKGQPTFEGEIYRQIDNLINDNADLISNAIDPGVRDGAGYTGIADVKRKDGSIDLTPLIIGSQGTLGMVSEVILKTEYVGKLSLAAIAFADWESARDSLEFIASLEPAVMELLDGGLFESALAQGKKYEFYTNASEADATNAVLLVGFDDINERHRNKRLKKLNKFIGQTSAYIECEADTAKVDALLALREVTSVIVTPDGMPESTPPLVDGAYISAGRFEDFMSSLEELGQKYHLTLPIYGRVLDSVYHIRPTFQLHKVGDRQKLMKFTDEYARLVASHGGHLIGEAGEGRFKALFAHKDFEDDLAELYTSIRTIFDPLGVMNTGVKQPGDVKNLVTQLRKDYNLSAFVNHSPTN